MLDAFETLQLARYSESAAAIKKLSDRAISTDKKLRLKLRKLQDTKLAIQKLSWELENEYLSKEGKLNIRTINYLQERRDLLASKKNNLKEKISRTFPSYANLVDARHLNINNAQSLLNKDEALLTFSSSYDLK